MKLYDSIKVKISFDTYIAEPIGEKREKRHIVRAQWHVRLSIGEGTEARHMAVPFTTGLRELRVTGYIGGRLRTKRKGKYTVVDERDRRYVEHQMLCSVLDIARGKSLWLTHIVTNEPDLHSVLYCIVSDSDGFEDGISFEDWADNYGFDSDSRKAEETYHACMKQARAFREFLGGSKNVEDLSTFVRMIDDMGEPAARVAWGEQQNSTEISTLSQRFNALRDEADRRLLNAAQKVLKDCPSLKTACAAMGALAFYRKDGTPMHPDDVRCTAKEKEALEEFLRQGDEFQNMFGATYGPWKIEENGNIITDW